MHKLHACGWVVPVTHLSLDCTIIQSSHWIWVFVVLQMKQTLARVPSTGSSISHPPPSAKRLNKSPLGSGSEQDTFAEVLLHILPISFDIQISIDKFYSPNVFSAMILHVQMPDLLRKTVQLPIPNWWDNIALLLFSGKREGLIIVTL